MATMTGCSLLIQRKQYAEADTAVTRRTIIENLRLDIPAGAFVCLVGPSGCGKTTLLNMLAGLDADFEGQIRHGDLPSGAKPRLGYVFQNPRLLPWRTVRENIALALPEDHDRTHVDHLFDVVGLPPAIQALYPERLSLGMSRRAALVRAFAVNPNLLLMDEPLVSLDPPTARRIRQLILQLWMERPHTVLFVTHDLGEAVELGDRLVFLSPSPARVVGDIPVDIPRAQRDSLAIEDFRQRLRRECPALAGLL